MPPSTTLTSPADLEVKFGRPDFQEDAHPRDRKGRWIKVFAKVKILGGATGTVQRNVGGGRLEVKRDSDGKNVIVHRNYLEVTAEPDGKAPAVADRDGSNAPEALRVEAPSADAVEADDEPGPARSNVPGDDTLDDAPDGASTGDPGGRFADAGDKSKVAVSVADMRKGDTARIPAKYLGDWQGAPIMGRVLGFKPEDDPDGSGSREVARVQRIDGTIVSVPLDGGNGQPEVFVPGKEPAAYRSMPDVAPTPRPGRDGDQSPPPRSNPDVSTPTPPPPAPETPAGDDEATPTPPEPVKAPTAKSPLNPDPNVPDHPLVGTRVRSVTDDDDTTGVQGILGRRSDGTYYVADPPEVPSSSASERDITGKIQPRTATTDDEFLFDDYPDEMTIREIDAAITELQARAAKIPAGKRRGDEFRRIADRIDWLSESRDDPERADEAAEADADARTRPGAGQLGLPGMDADVPLPKPVRKRETRRKATVDDGRRFADVAAFQAHAARLAEGSENADWLNRIAQADPKDIALTKSGQLAVVKTNRGEWSLVAPGVGRSLNYSLRATTRKNALDLAEFVEGNARDQDGAPLDWAGDDLIERATAAAGKTSFPVWANRLRADYERPRDAPSDRFGADAVSRDDDAREGERRSAARDERVKPLLDEGYTEQGGYGERDLAIGDSVVLVDGDGDETVRGTIESFRDLSNGRNMTIAGREYPVAGRIFAKPREGGRVMPDLADVRRSEDGTREFTVSNTRFTADADGKLTRGVRIDGSDAPPQYEVLLDRGMTKFEDRDGQLTQVITEDGLRALDATPEAPDEQDAPDEPLDVDAAAQRLLEAAAADRGLTVPGREQSIPQAVQRIRGSGNAMDDADRLRSANQALDLASSLDLYVADPEAGASPQVTSAVNALRDAAVRRAVDSRLQSISDPDLQTLSERIDRAGLDTDGIDALMLDRGYSSEGYIRGGRAGLRNPIRVEDARQLVDTRVRMNSGEPDRVRSGRPRGAAQETAFGGYPIYIDGRLTRSDDGRLQIISDGQAVDVPDGAYLSGDDQFSGREAMLGVDGEPVNPQDLTDTELALGIETGRKYVDGTEQQFSADDETVRDRLDALRAEQARRQGREYVRAADDTASKDANAVPPVRTLDEARAHLRTSSGTRSGGGEGLVDDPNLEVTPEGWLIRPVPDGDGTWEVFDADGREALALPEDLPNRDAALAYSRRARELNIPTIYAGGLSKREKRDRVYQLQQAQGAAGRETVNTPTVRTLDEARTHLGEQARTKFTTDSPQYRNLMELQADPNLEVTPEGWLTTRSRGDGTWSVYDADGRLAHSPTFSFDTREGALAFTRDLRTDGIHDATLGINERDRRDRRQELDRRARAAQDANPRSTTGAEDVGQPDEPVAPDEPEAPTAPNEPDDATTETPTDVPTDSPYPATPAEGREPETVTGARLFDGDYLRGNDGQWHAVVSMERITRRAERELPNGTSWPYIEDTKQLAVVLANGEQLTVGTGQRVERILATRVTPRPQGNVVRTVRPNEVRPGMVIARPRSGIPWGVRVVNESGRTDDDPDGRLIEGGRVARVDAVNRSAHMSRGFGKTRTSRDYRITFEDGTVVSLPIQTKIEILDTPDATEVPETPDTPDTPDVPETPALPEPPALDTLDDDGLRGERQTNTESLRRLHADGSRPGDAEFDRLIERQRAIAVEQDRRSLAGLDSTPEQVRTIDVGAGDHVVVEDPRGGFTALQVSDVRRTGGTVVMELTDPTKPDAATEVREFSDADNVLRVPNTPAGDLGDPVDITPPDDTPDVTPDEDDPREPGLVDDLKVGDLVHVGDVTAEITAAEDVADDPDLRLLTLRMPDGTSETLPFGRQAVLDLADPPTPPDITPHPDGTTTARPVLYTYQRRNILALGIDLDPGQPDAVRQAAARVRARQALSSPQAAALAAAIRERAGRDGVRPVQQRAMNRLAWRMDAASAQADNATAPDLPNQTVTAATPDQIATGDHVALPAGGGRALHTGRVTAVRSMMRGRVVEVTTEQPDGTRETRLVTKGTPVFVLQDLPDDKPVVPDTGTELVSTDRLRVGDVVLSRDSTDPDRDVRATVLRTEDGIHVLDVTYETWDGKTLNRTIPAGEDARVLRVQRGQNSADQPLDALTVKLLDTPEFVADLTTLKVGDYVDVTSGGNRHVGFIAGIEMSPRDERNPGAGTYVSKLSIQHEDNDRFPNGVRVPEAAEVHRLAPYDEGIAVALRAAEDRRRAARRAHLIALPLAKVRNDALEGLQQMVDRGRLEQVRDSGHLFRLMHGNDPDADFGTRTSFAATFEAPESFEITKHVDGLLNQLVGNDKGKQDALRPQAENLVLEVNTEARTALMRSLQEAAPAPGETYGQALTRTAIAFMADRPSTSDLLTVGHTLSQLVDDLREDIDGPGETLTVKRPEGGDLSTRMAAYRAQIGGEFGKAEVEVPTIGGRVTLGKLAAGELPEITTTKVLKWDRSTDGGPGAQTMRHLDVVNAAGAELDDEVQAEMIRVLLADPDIPAGTLLGGESGDDALKRLDEELSEVFREISAINRTRRDGVAAADSTAAIRARLNKEAEEQLAKVHARQTDVYTRRQALRNRLDKAQRDAVIRTLERAGIKFGGKAVDQFYQGKGGPNAWVKRGKPLTERSESVRAFRFAEASYPASWVEKWRDFDAADGTFDIQVRSRAYYQQRSDSGRVPATIALSSDQNARTKEWATSYGAAAVHELGHGMERAVPGLKAAEEAFLWSRLAPGEVGDRSLPRQTNVYERDVGMGREVGWKDDFREHYSGKTYNGMNTHPENNRAYELWTTTVESLLAGSDHMDTGMRQWALGVLATVGHN